LVNAYLFAAYSLVWLIFLFYAWNLSRRQAKLKRDLEAFKAKIEGKSPLAGR